jgi:hypothetical protein
MRCHDPATRADAQELIALGVARYGTVDVVVIARPQRHISTMTANAVKETEDHASSKDTSTPTH